MESITALDLTRHGLVVDPSRTSFEEYVNLIKLECKVDAFREDEDAPMFDGLRPERMKKLELWGSIKGSIKVLPKSINQFNNLTSLGFYGCDFKVLPDSICELTCLDQLCLRECDRLERLPESFGQLTRLTALEITSNSKLKSLPESFGQLTHLKHLDLFSCFELKWLPESFGQLTSLKHLHLMQCFELEWLPESFVELKSLTYLYTNGCKSLKLPKTQVCKMIKMCKLHPTCIWNLIKSQLDFERSDSESDYNQSSDDAE
jgi:Leucine-rich repeat (LRR) protein